MKVYPVHGRTIFVPNTRNPVPESYDVPEAHIVEFTRYVLDGDLSTVAGGAKQTEPAKQGVEK